MLTQISYQSQCLTQYHSGVVVCAASDETTRRPDATAAYAVKRGLKAGGAQTGEEDHRIDWERRLGPAAARLRLKGAHDLLHLGVVRTATVVSADRGAPKCTLQ